MQVLFACKGGRTFININIFHGGIIVLCAFGAAVHLVPETPGDDGPVHGDVVSHDADAFCFRNFANIVGCRYENFRGNTAAVQTGAAELAFFNEGDAQALASRRVDDDICRARADYYQII